MLDINGDGYIIDCDVVPEKVSSWSLPIVAVMGLYNKGKTFLLNRLGRTSFGSDKRTHTSGISIKYSYKDELKMLILDTAGFQSPLVCNEIDSLEQSIALRTASEYFQRDIIYNMADVLIIVLNDLTYSDQSFIYTISQTLKQQKSNKKFFIIHNFKDVCDMNEAIELWREQVLSPFKLEEVVNDIYIPNVFRFRSAFNIAYKCTHLFMINDNAKNVLQNDATVQFLRNAIQQLPGEGLVMERLKDAFKYSLNYYLQCDEADNNAELDVEISLKTKRVVSNITNFQLRDYIWDPKNGTVHFSKIGNEQCSVPYSYVESENTLDIEIELPGVEPAPLKGDINSYTITYNGRVNTPLMQNQKSSHVTSRNKTRDFTFKLPPGYDPRKDSWKYKKENGILYISVPKWKEEYKEDLI
jgi:HSP20 family molecular chaperone IbpA/GTPase SAR1 family protein